MAGRIPDSFIQDLIARTDIVQVIGERLDLRKAGKEYRARSPFTNEKTPSFFVSPAKQMFFDFSSGKNGTVISFLMEYDRLQFVEAVEELAQRAGLTVPREGGAPAERLVLDGPLDALAAAERIYKAELKQSPEAIEYLKQRGVTGETARRFGIGFAPDRWDTIAGQVPEKHALEAGLLVRNEEKGRTYDFYRRRIMFPVRNLRGQVITFGGRVLPGSDDDRKYLNGRETPLFDKGRQLYGLYEAREEKGAIPCILVVEGYMDVVMLAQHDIPYAVATMGTATTREHLNLLFKSTSRVVFCFDGDRAGRAAAWRALEQALPEAFENREILFMFLPDSSQGGKHDPDSFVRELGADEFNRRVTQAQSLSGFLLSQLSSQVNLATPDGRARLAALARPHLERLRQGPLRELIIDELSRTTRLNRADFEAAATRAERAGEAQAGAGSLDGIASRPARRALQLLLEQPALAARVADLEQLAQSDAPGTSLLVAVVEHFREHPEASAAQLLERWREEERGKALARVALEPLELAEDAIEREFADAIAHLAQKALRARAQALLAEARRRELSSAEKRELDGLSRQLAGAKPV
ncbi:MAG: DNA primase [Gammaproteobacteria bacterium]